MSYQKGAQIVDIEIDEFTLLLLYVSELEIDQCTTSRQNVWQREGENVLRKYTEEFISPFIIFTMNV